MGIQRQPGVQTRQVKGGGRRGYELSTVQTQWLLWQEVLQQHDVRTQSLPRSLWSTSEERRQLWCKSKYFRNDANLNSVHRNVLLRTYAETNICSIQLLFTPSELSTELCQTQIWISSVLLKSVSARLSVLRVTLEVLSSTTASR